MRPSAFQFKLMVAVNIKKCLVSFITRLDQCEHIKTSFNFQVVFHALSYSSMLVVDHFPNLCHYKNDLQMRITLRDQKIWQNESFGKSG